jgi:glycosyltransferase involved in cell wall biosynthesis
MKKILIVAMADSVHTARWLEQFENSKDKFVLFPSSPHRRIHPKIVRLLGASSPMQISIPKGLSKTGLILAALDKFFNNRLRGYLLRRVINKFEPNILHAVETQGAGYISLEALGKVEKKPFFILTLWGSDLFWFRKFNRHKLRLMSLLPLVDLLSMECERDVEIARDLGFTGRLFPPYPVTGGYEIADGPNSNVKTKTSARRMILVKGHTRFVGRGTQALHAIEELSRQLVGYQAIVYSADPKAKRLANLIAKRSGLPIKVFGRGQIAHQDLIEMFESARIYVGISLSDGISVSLQEAMVCGAFPIQTDTSCADEWILKEKSGFIVSPNDHNGLVKAIRTALENDDLVDAAAEINYEVARKRLDKSKVMSVSTKFYDSSADSVTDNKR